jgi:anaerobic dimethyl sulfoxide reductase subunit C (anchor subunit)
MIMILAEEWPLMTFTMLAQLAIGTFIVLMIIKALLGNKDTEAANSLTKLGFTVVGPLTILALLFSLFHLGDPLGAYRSILNLGSSWLSREIITVGGFLGLWALFWLTIRKNQPNAFLGWLTALLGLVGILSMANIYSSSVRPAWADPNTLITFLGTTFALGVLGAISTIVYSLKGKSLLTVVTKALKDVSYIGIAAIVLPLAYLPIFKSGLRGSGDAAAEASVQILNDSMTMLVMRGLFSVVGIALLVYILNKQSKNSQEFPVGLIYLALGLVFVGEFVGRYLFYAWGVSPIIG